MCVTLNPNITEIIITTSSDVNFNQDIIIHIQVLDVTRVKDIAAR